MDLIGNEWRHTFSDGCSIRYPADRSNNWGADAKISPCNLGEECPSYKQFLRIEPLATILPTDLPDDQKARVQRMIFGARDKTRRIT